MSDRTIVALSVACSALTGILTAWLLKRWIGFGWLYLLLVLPVSMAAMHAVGGTMIRVLFGQKRR